MSASSPVSDCINETSESSSDWGIFFSVFFVFGFFVFFLAEIESTAACTSPVVSAGSGSSEIFAFFRLFLGVFGLGSTFGIFSLVALLDSDWLSSSPDPFFRVLFSSEVGSAPVIGINNSVVFRIFVAARVFVGGFITSVPEVLALVSSLAAGLFLFNPEFLGIVTTLATDAGFVIVVE